MNSYVLSPALDLSAVVTGAIQLQQQCIPDKMENRESGDRMPDKAIVHIGYIALRQDFLGETRSTSLLVTDPAAFVRSLVRSFSVRRSFRPLVLLPELPA